MPIKKRLINMRTSRAVILPKGWLDEIERMTGRTVEEVLLEVNGDLRIKPILKGTTHRKGESIRTDGYR